jgi:hypothetical protein
VQKNHSSYIDNIFLNYARINYYTILPFIDGLCDHDAQYVLIHDIDTLNLPIMIKNIRKINKNSIADLLFTFRNLG